MSLENPQNKFEIIAARALAGRRALGDKSQAERGDGKNLEIFAAGVPAVFETQESKGDISVRGSVESGPDEKARRSGALEKNNPPRKKSLTPAASGGKTSINQRTAADRDADGGGKRGGGEFAKRCQTGWDACRVLDLPFGVVKDPANAIGLFRLNANEGCLVTRAWTAQGVPFALYDGRTLQDVDGKDLPQETCPFVLADEPAAAWLQGKLPADPIPLPWGTAYAAQSQWGVENYPYSGVHNVLLACDVKGLMAGAVWACKLEQVKRFGGMPVIAFPKGGAAVLRDIDWRDVTIRASDKTWELAKDHMPLKAHQRREGLK